METESLTPDAEETAMRDMGQQADAEQGREPVEVVTETPKPQAPEPTQEPPPEVEQPPEAPPETEPVTGQPQRDPVTGKFQKPETEYSKAQKEEIRKARTWQNIQAEKEEVRAEKARWQEELRMRQLEATRQQYQPLKKDGLTAQEYFEGAKRFEQDSDYENALKAYKVASEMGHAEQERYQQIQQVEKEYQWRTRMQQALQSYPEIANPDNPVHQHISRIIGQNDWLYNAPNGVGFLAATEFAHMLTQMDRIKELEDENVALKAENEKYRHKSQPGRSGYAAPRTGEKDFDSMDLDEMESHLRGVTSEADNWR